VAEPIFVRAGEVRLGQVFVNLILNAVDAMGGQDTKRIEIEIAGDPRPCVKVRDTGPGIKEPERVFEPFYSTKEVGDGMGLGLSISYGLVQSFGGNIRGANMASDTGSANTGSGTASGGAEFTVELDRWPDQDTAGAERLEQTG
jgi:two-component system C4-dicarboxylate transport sensor histidine kinase DctB